jgi:hypothetical protein
MSLCRLHLRIRLDIFNVYFTLSSIHSNPSPSSLPPFSLYFRRQFSTFYLVAFVNVPCIRFYLLFNISRFPLGASSGSIHLSQCRLLCPLRRLRRRMCDRPRQFVYFKFVFPPSPRSPSLHSSFLSFWLLAVSHRSCAILFSFLIFHSSSSGFAFLVVRFRVPRLVSRSSHSVTRFRLLVFPVSRSSFLALSSIYTLFSPFSLRPLAPPLSSVPPFLDVLTFTSLLISGWVHLSRTHAGFRWCASSIGSVSNVLLLLCRQALALIVPSCTRIHH